MFPSRTDGDTHMRAVAHPITLAEYRMRHGSPLAAPRHQYGRAATLAEDAQNGLRQPNRGQQTGAEGVRGGRRRPGGGLCNTRSVWLVMALERR